MRTMVQTLQAHGHLVMPYINPTWWDEQSPTLSGRPPADIRALAVIGDDGQGVVERYSGEDGYVVSPYAPGVQARLAALMTQWRSDVPVDCVFEDQIGARAWRRDFNPAAPDPLRYSDGWLAHVSTYRNQCLMTEQVWDRLTRDLVGAHGSLITWAREFDFGDTNFGAGNWDAYPLATYMFHDKILQYQHDLSTHSMTHDLATLSFNLQFGLMLSYDWAWGELHQLDNPWLRVVSDLQRALAARYAGQGLVDYAPYQNRKDVTVSDFGPLKVIVNHNHIQTLNVFGHRVAPGGFYAWSSDGSLQAGLFANAFAGRAISAGEHLVLIERQPQRVTVRQLLGPDTVLVIAQPDGGGSSGLSVRAYDAAGALLSTLPSRIEKTSVVFVYVSALAGKAVDRVEIGALAGSASATLMPAVAR